MIKNIKTYFESLFNNGSTDASSDHKTIELATAVLMIEISLADDHIQEEERNTIKVIQFFKNSIKKYLEDMGESNKIISEVMEGD